MKSTSFVFIFVFSLVLSMVFAQAALNRTIGSSADLETVKTAFVSYLDKKIAAINNFKTTKVANASIDAEDKTLINSMLDSAIARLEKDKADVQATTSIAELQTVRKQMVQDMIASKEDVRKAYNDLKNALNDEALAKLDAAVAAINVKVDEIEKNCPQQKNKIDIAQAEFNQIVIDLQALNQMYDSRADPVAVSAKALQVSDDISDLVYDLEEIVSVCAYYNSGYQEPVNTTA